MQGCATLHPCLISYAPTGLCLFHFYRFNTVAVAHLRLFAFHLGEFGTGFLFQVGTLVVVDDAAERFLGLEVVILGHIHVSQRNERLGDLKIVG